MGYFLGELCWWIVGGFWYWSPGLKKESWQNNHKVPLGKEFSNVIDFWIYIFKQCFWGWNCCKKLNWSSSKNKFCKCSLWELAMNQWGWFLTEVSWVCKRWLKVEGPKKASPPQKKRKKNQLKIWCRGYLISWGQGDSSQNIFWRIQPSCYSYMHFIFPYLWLAFQ